MKHVSDPHVTHHVEQAHVPVKHVTDPHHSSVDPEADVSHAHGATIHGVVEYVKDRGLFPLKSVVTISHTVLHATISVNWRRSGHYWPQSGHFDPKTHLFRRVVAGCISTNQHVKMDYTCA